MQATILHADKEHKGIEIVVPLVMVTAGILIFLVIDAWLLRPLLSGSDLDGFRPLSRWVISIVLGVLIGAGVELILKRVWPSGRLLKLDDRHLTAQEKDVAEISIEWGQRVNVLRWQYLMSGFPRGGRERRVPNGHFLMAVRLLQDEQEVIAHCYVPPKKNVTVPGYRYFASVDMAAQYSGGVLKRLSRPERPIVNKELLASQTGQVWAAEKERWRKSLELEFEDFVVLMDAVERYGATARS